MTILDEIINYKYKEVELNKSLFPISLLEKSTYFKRQPTSFREHLLKEDKVGIIAEFKRKSPSKGIINDKVLPADVSLNYFQAGASALSILTDKKYFGGNTEDLRIARSFNDCPILRKDFMVDEHQVIEAKSIGADVILLIAAALSEKRIKDLTNLAKDIGLEVLLEVHNREELGKINDHIDAVGVNNRNLKDFSVDIGISMELASLIPDRFVKISESGIHSTSTIVELKKVGYKGFLIGERFMHTDDPGKACENFIINLKREINNEG